MKKIPLIILTLIGLALFFAGSFYVHLEHHEMDRLNALSNQNAAEFDKMYNEFQYGFNAK